MQRYGDRLLAYWEGREEETGVDIESGRELSENGRRRAREKRERQAAKEREREKALPVERPTKEDAIRANEAGNMEVDQNGSESHPPDPAQPPPEPAETASAPSSPPPDGINGGDHIQTDHREMPKHSDTAPPSSAAFVPAANYQSGPMVTSPPTVKSAIPVENKKERSRSQNQGRSLSFSRPDAGATTAGMSLGWARGEQGLVVSGTS